MERFLVSSLSDFRRATSRIATFIIVVSLFFLLISMLLLRQRFWGSVVVLLYLGLALILKVTIRRTETRKVDNSQVCRSDRDPPSWSTVTSYTVHLIRYGSRLCGAG
jgi:hypothetical protein